MQYDESEGSHFPILTLTRLVKSPP